VQRVAARGELKARLLKQGRQRSRIREEGGETVGDQLMCVVVLSLSLRFVLFSGIIILALRIAKPETPRPRT